MSINIAGAFIRILGYGIVFFAAGKLQGYNRAFWYFRLATCLMLAVSVVLAVSDVFDFLYTEMLVQSNIFSPLFDKIMGVVELCASLFFNVVMLYAVRAIAIETEVKKIAVNSIRNAIFIVLYFVLNIIAYIPFPFAEAYARNFAAPVLILYFVWIILNLILIYSCYARICDEDDVDMARKPSRFDFVNKMREEMDEKQRKAAERNAEYKRQKQEKRKSRGEK